MNYTAEQREKIDGVRFYLNQLEEPYRTRALSQVDDKYVILKLLSKSRFEAVLRFCNWEKTKEGFDYWGKFLKTLPLDPKPYTPQETKSDEELLAELEAKVKELKANIEAKADLTKFDAEKSLKGEACEMMNGRKVMAIHANFLNEKYPLYALMEDGDICTFTIEGKYYLYGIESYYNLKMSSHE